MTKSKQEKEIEEGRKFPNFAEGGCYQWVYCSECLMYPMGLGCPSQDGKNRAADLWKDLDKFGISPLDEQLKKSKLLRKGDKR